MAAASGADMIIGVMCTFRGAQATEKAAQFGLFLMCRLRSEAYPPSDFNKSPPGTGLSDLSPPVKLVSGQKPTRVGYLISGRGNMILLVSD